MTPSWLSRHGPAGIVVLLLFALPVLTGCEDGSLNEPQVQNDLFTSYVSIGNSITAGFQSGGINRTLQNEGFPVLLAEQMGTDFTIPALNPPGCPPPFESFFTPQGVPDPQRPQGTSGETCALRDVTTRPVSNVAVPNARVIDVLENLNPAGASNPLTQFILGGRTQIEAALDANPTFATIWIGNNDVLGPALQGSDDATEPADFEDRYTQILDRLTAAESFRGGVLIGVANPTFLPIFSPGPAYALAAQTGEFPDNFQVAPNCTESTGSGLTPLIPLEYGFGLLGQAQANPNQTVTLDCEAENAGVLTLPEVRTLAGRVEQYNAFIEQEAQERGLAYLDPNEVLGLLYATDDGDGNDLIPKFPDTDPTNDLPPFGDFFSLDGVHPSSVTHRVVAAQLVQVINEEYGTSLQPPENVPQLPTPPGGGEQ